VCWALTVARIGSLFWVLDSRVGRWWMLPSQLGILTEVS
jgi:hypothetical protein